MLLIGEQGASFRDGTIGRVNESAGDIIHLLSHWHSMLIAVTPVEMTSAEHTAIIVAGVTFIGERILSCHFAHNRQRRRFPCALP